MNTHGLFIKYNSKIRLNDAKKKALKKNRRALRKRIRDHFTAKKWDMPGFSSQGSFPLDTNLNPIIKQDADGNNLEEYDLDDGVYFICNRSDRKEPATYHDQIKKAVDGHAKSVVDKNTCVRVVYSDGHHIDLPIYWLEKEGDTPELAHKADGYTQSDPKSFKDWVDGKISDIGNNGQLRRLIRYFKGWVDFRQNFNASLNLPSGFIWTILVCEEFVGDDRDDISFQETIRKIKNRLDASFSCKRPTTPVGEELLNKYNKEVVVNELGTLLGNADSSVKVDCEKEASNYWRKSLGDRYPLGKKKDEEVASEKAARVKVGAPWISN